jgi:LmbE family N-acetylglucosaminyl deacetylase
VTLLRNEFALGICVAALVLCSVPLAQNRMTFPLVSQTSGHAALGLALRRLNVSATFMQAPAHPDDEHNALLALFRYGMGFRAVDVQTNRGDGGQNEIGPELFQDMAVLRTSELLSAHGLDGAEQYFTRAIDYGYSFDPEEVIDKWGRDEIVGDFVRLMRTLRPDVVLTMNIQERGGDRAHEATAILVRDAYTAAGNPAMFPGQLNEGLRPWQPKKLYFTGSAPSASVRRRVVRPDTSAYDPLLGRTYSEVGADAHSYHICQGMNVLPALPGSGGRGFGGGAYQLVDSRIPGQMERDDASMFDGIDTTLAGIAQYAGAKPPGTLKAGLAAIADHATRAQKAFESGNDAAVAAPVEAGLTAVRALRGQLRSMPLDESARYEIDFRLDIKQRDYEDAVLAAHGLSFDAVADDGLVTGGQQVKLSLVAVNRGRSEVVIKDVAIAGFDGAPTCWPGRAEHNRVQPGSAEQGRPERGRLPQDGVYTCVADVHVPAAAKLTTPYFTDEYWKKPTNPAIDRFAPGVPFGVPFAPTPFRVTFRVGAGEAEVAKEIPVQFRYVRDTFHGDKRMELNIVPALSVRATPALVIVPAGSSESRPGPVVREIHVAVTNGLKGPAPATVRLEAQDGWTVTPATATVSFAREDESLSARFQVAAPTGVKLGTYILRAVVTSTATGDASFSSGYQEIEYPHIERRQIIKPAEIELKVVDVRTAPNLTVGYIVGAGDQVPPAIEQLGARVGFIDRDELAWGDLSQYDVIVTGVRAYERRDDLRAYNQRLLDYAARGGTVIVQYNKFEFNQEQYGPYPARVSGNRIADEEAPVTVLVPGHPVFNFPNKIGKATWDGWVQERGLYFLGMKDPKYVDLISMVDTFRDNPGEKLGSLVEGRIGKGRWIYLGLSLWRQLPAGTEGAYQLLANLIELAKAPIN